MNKKFWATAFTLTGTIIGAGILGLPYVFAKSGFLIGLIWLILLGFIILIVNLYLGEIGLRTKDNHQLTGYAKKYLGKNGEKVMFFAMAFGIYSALLAYLIGEGQSLSILFTGSLKYALFFGIGFWIVMTMLLKFGLKGLKNIETWGVLAIAFLVIFIFIWYLPEVNYTYLSEINLPNIFIPMGVILFALLGFTSIPELRMEIKGQEKKYKKAIMFGILVPIILYLLFCFTFVGILGSNVPEVATLSLGKFVIILGIFTMLTSYFVLSFSFRDIFRYDFKSSNFTTFFWVCLFPLLLYLIISFFNLLDFVQVLGIGGVISGGLTGILILIINKRAKKLGNRKPEFSIPINWAIIILVSLIFILGILAEFFL